MTKALPGVDYLGEKARRRPFQARVDKSREAGSH